MRQNPTVPITVIIPVLNRIHALTDTLDHIANCVPAPEEIIVHVDGGSPEVLRSLENRHDNTRILSSQARLGAGGSREVMIKAAAHEWVANFDDNSFPLDKDYFQRVLDSVGQHPEAAVITGSTLEEDWARTSAVEVGIYSGCACVFNRAWFLRTNGFVPLPLAQAMEEVDLSLQLHALGGKVVLDPALRVHHPPVHFSGDPRTEAVILCNMILFTFLRYPVLLWWLIPRQMLGRIIWLWRNGCARAVLPAMRMLPGHLWKYRRWRRPVPLGKVLSWLRLRKKGPKATSGGFRKAV